VENITNGGCEIWTVDYRLKIKTAKSRKEFWKGATRSSKVLNIRNKLIRQNVSNANNLEKNGEEHFKWYGNVLRVGGNGCSKVILTGGRKEVKEQEDLR
jgi:hypothetical protein